MQGHKSNIIKQMKTANLPCCPKFSICQHTIPHKPLMKFLQLTVDTKFSNIKRISRKLSSQGEIIHLADKNSFVTIPHKPLMKFLQLTSDARFRKINRISRKLSARGKIIHFAAKTSFVLDPKQECLTLVQIFSVQST